MRHQKSINQSISLSLVASAGLLMSSAALAHGYVKSPESRAYACNQGGNVNCGAVQWEPQSVEGPSGFPELGPVDGKLASAGQGAFAPLDEQSSTRWSRSDISAGWNEFSWQFTANHVTRNWRYYLTEQNWDPNKPLSRSSFDLTPFCVIEGDMVQPPKFVTHECNVPARASGYQVILALWEVGDTANSFYNVIDVNFNDGSTTPDTWSDVGNINPALDLKVGDSAMTRVFTAEGEQASMQTSITIENTQQGLKNNWPHLLATAVNREQTKMKAGQKSATGEIVPVYGKNEIFAKDGSGINRVEVGFDIAPEPGNSVEVSSLADSYEINEGKALVSFDITTNTDMQVSVQLSSHNGQASGFQSQQVNSTTASFEIDVIEPVVGHYHMLVKAEPTQGEVIVQNHDLFLTEAAAPGDADYVFPQGIVDYQAGTTVFQPKNGKTYQCKPFPYSGYCIQWSETATGFEPGVGSDWGLAWIEL
ncbi:N-acetylglucosamine-binding protein GbpA [Shewanella nanhaiensis]|uniref:N-acetylglucosamine-binding protein GbpA n=1 Tax=Shewanella nanhaiensis TaxID=2864872 RepID=A0ABS7E4M1_9GAMM|nr:N-acetylglucosamine-binding protein GbpA [Shewanella nanhaiensis]MBW8184096.1 N-acetylglucosamine-binding protein GbpA [Shewanella nanhaiensis]